tara:strand:+ start:126 stop:341 length:216 start_codon:yes stop_codon:yes gene_type:complete
MLWELERDKSSTIFTQEKNVMETMNSLTQTIPVSVDALVPKLKISRAITPIIRGMGILKGWRVASRLNIAR